MSEIVSQSVSGIHPYLEHLDNPSSLSYNSAMELTQYVKETALLLGFDAVGITHAGPIDDGHRQRLGRWFAAGHAAELRYMARLLDKRVDPGRLLKRAQSVVCVALNYNPPESEVVDSSPVPLGRIADFALYDDYHGFMRGRLRRLANAIRRAVAPRASVFRSCVDSVPLAERAIAQRAGLGFLALNHCLIHPRLGCKILLGELVTTVKLTPDWPMEQPCLGCEKCFRACPTGALGRDGSFDAGKCISYLTIEHKGEITSELAARIGDRLFGCDECIRCCPHQVNMPPASSPDFHFHPSGRKISLHDILKWNETDFDRTFAGSAVHRIGLAQLQRNARICLDNAK
jgi:epoxyqueuosine reductase